MKTEAAQCHDSCEASPACTDAGGGALCPGTKLSALVGNQGCSLLWEDVATTTDVDSPLYPWLGQGVTIGHLCPKACGSCDANASRVGEPPRYRWHLGCILLKMPALLTGQINGYISCAEHFSTDGGTPYATCSPTQLSITGHCRVHDTAAALIVIRTTTFLGSGLRCLDDLSKIFVRTGDAAVCGDHGGAAAAGARRAGRLFAEREVRVGDHLRQQRGPGRAELGRLPDRELLRYGGGL